MSNLYNKLDKGSFFKFVVGLGNRDLENIKKMAVLYATAEIDMFDLTPDDNVIDSVIAGIKLAGKNPDDFEFCISFSIDNDNHGRKAHIDQDKCVKCLRCIKQCPHGAINFDRNSSKVFINKDKCIGCGKCHCSAITYSKDEIDVIKKISEFKNKYKIDCIELHISGTKSKIGEEEYKKVKKKFPNLPVGICISRLNYSEAKLKKLIAKLQKHTNGEKLIIQADGLSMSGKNNDYSATLQAVSIAQILENENVYILISGGTNQLSTKLANLCNVKINGVSIGSYGRLLVLEYINNPEFWYNDDVFNSALQKVQELVNSVKVL